MCQSEGNAYLEFYTQGKISIKNDIIGKQKLKSSSPTEVEIESYFIAMLISITENITNLNWVKYLNKIKSLKIYE